MQIKFVVPKRTEVNVKRDRFLTEAIGDCWHEYDPGKPIRKFSLKGYICRKCKRFFSANNDFSTLEDFLKLHEWAKNNPELGGFVSGFKAREFVNEKKGPNKRKLFADGLYEILSKKGRET